MPRLPSLKMVGSLVLSTSILTSCASIEENTGISQERLGQIAGGVTGALLGSAVKSDLRPLAILLGAAGGAYLGGKIANSLSEEDKVASEAVMADTLETADSGEEVLWESETSEAKGVFTPGETQPAQRDVTVVRDVRVEELPPVELIGKPYEAIKSSNVRSRPDKEGNLVGSLSPGESFTAVGKVTGADWIMVAKNNVTVGFVYAPLVTPSAEVAVAQPPKLREAVNLDEFDGEVVQVTAKAPVEGVALGGIDLDSMVVADSVQATTECRTMDYSITDEENKTAKGEFEACKGSDGAWEIS